jgi:hypothetical protein
MIFSGCALRNRFMLMEVKDSCERYRNAEDCYYLGKALNDGEYGFKDESLALHYSVQACLLGSQNGCSQMINFAQQNQIKSAESSD